MGNTSCKVDNGKGKKKWLWSKCEVTDCNDGYRQTEDGTCVLSGPCTPNPLVEHAVKYIYNYNGSACVVDTCAQGYTKDGGKCVPVSSGTSSGSRTGTVTGTSSGTGSGTVDQWGVCTTTSQCKAPYQCLVSNVAANISRCLTVDDCAWAAEQDDSLENNCYGQPIIRGYSPSIHLGPYGKGDGASITSVEACRLYAGSKSGASGFTWRNASHDTMPNTCITYGGMPAGASATDYAAKNMHSSGCVDKTKKFPNCS